MNRIKGLGIGLGMAAMMVVGLACGGGETQGPAQDQPGPSGSPGENTPPVMSGGAPLVRLTYEGAIYHSDPLSTVEAANLNEDDLELVGVTTESNRLAPGSGESLDIYRLKNNEDGYVYTLEPASTYQDEGEDGQTITTITVEASWLRWSAADSDTGVRQMEIAQALESAEPSEVKISGHLIVDRVYGARLCSVLLESGPPQCGGDRIILLGFDASSVPDSKTPQRPSEIGTTRWTDSYITVTGINGLGGLSEVQLLPVISTLPGVRDGLAGTGIHSDEVSTPTPPTEIPLTQVIEMARTGHLQSIEVSGDKLEVTTLEGVTFASRKPEGTSIGALLDREGVDHIASGLQITVKGFAARERGSASAGETTIAVTPTPTSTSDQPDASTIIISPTRR